MTISLKKKKKEAGIAAHGFKYICWTLLADSAEQEN